MSGGARALLVLSLALAAPASAQEVDRVITATADARDAARLGDRVLVATEGGLVVLRGSLTGARASAPPSWTVERVLGPREGLPGARLRSISVTDEGAWVGGVEGTALLSVSSDGELRVERTLPLRRVRRVVRFAGSTWLASYGDGLHRLDENGALVRVPLGDAHAYRRLTDVLVRGDDLWVATSGVGVLRVGADGRVRGRIRRREGLPSEHVWRLVPHGEDVLAATIDGVAELGAGRTGPIQRASRRLPVRDVRDVLVHGDTIWLASYGAGVFRAPLSGGAPRLVRGPMTQPSALLATESGVLVAHAAGLHLAPHPAGARVEPILAGGLPSGDVSALARAFGTLWAGTFGHGLARVRGGAFEPFESAHGRWGLDRRINDLASTGRGPSERLWIATDRGLSWHDGRIVSEVDDPAGPGRTHVTSLHVASDGALWVTSSRALCRHQRERWRCWSGDPSFPVMQLHAVTTDARGRVWVGSLHGLYRFDPARGTFARHSVSSGDLPVDWVTALVPFGDGVLAGTYHGGLAIGDGARFRTVREGEGGLPSGWVNPHAVRRVGDEVWIGTLERGLVTGRPGAWHHLTTAQGLPSDDVTAVLPEGDAVWVATRGGIARLTR